MRTAPSMMALVLACLLAACGSPPVPPPDAGGGGGGGGGDDAGASVTWYRDVLPVAQARCQSCHVAGGIGSFPMTGYEEAFAHAGAMAAAVRTRYMPPWMPAESCMNMQDSRRLEQKEIDVFTQWVDQGAVAGDPADAPAAADAGSGLPWVDFTLDPGATYTANTAVSDDYRCFVLDAQHTQDRDVIGFDITPGDRKLVHHVILYTALRADAVAKDNAEAGLGWTCYGGPGTPNPSNLGGWVPGMPVVRYPQGTGIVFPAGRVIVMQVHYNLGNGAGSDRTVAKLQLAQGRVPRPAQLIGVPQASFSIPPMATGYSVSRTVPSTSGTLWGVLPHMHTKGRKFKATYGSSCLVDIPAWDFHWQQLYFFAQPLQLTAGTPVTMTCTWDNPTGMNVTWGEGTNDEMCLNYYYVSQ